MTLFLIGFLFLAIPIWAILGILSAAGIVRGIHKNVFLVPIAIVLGGIVLTFFQLVGLFVVLYSMSVGQ